MTRLIAPRQPAMVIGDLRDPDIDRAEVERYHREAGVARARAAMAAERRWMSDRRPEGPLGYLLVFLCVFGIVLWILV